MIVTAQIAAGLDHRLALVLYLLLLLATAWPVVTAWLRVLPAEREPFAGADETSQKEGRDAFAIFLLVRQVNRINRKPEPTAPIQPATKECPYCLSTIPAKAVKCAHCTSDLSAGAGDGPKRPS